MSGSTNAARIMEYTYVCTGRGCGRVVRSNDDEFTTWLVARRVDDPAKVVVRCPQHITERTLRYAGIPLSKANFRKVRDECIKDMKRKTALLPPGFLIDVDPDLLLSVQGTGHTHGYRRRTP